MALVVPEIEASGVEPHHDRCGGKALHHAFIPRQDFTTGIAPCAVAGTSPQSHHAALRQPVVRKLLLDEEPKDLALHARILESLSLLVPEVEALNVEHEGTAPSSRALHHELSPGNDVVARGADLPVAQARPSLGETVHWQTVIDEFAVNEMTKDLDGIIHGDLSGNGDATTPDSPGSRRPAGVNPKRPRCRQGQYTRRAARVEEEETVIAPSYATGSE